ncbi:MAG: ABC transporter permease, partial [Bacteroidota bacterium]
ESNESSRIAVVDESGILGKGQIPSLKDGNTHFIRSSASLEELKKQVDEGVFNAILVIPPIKRLQAETHRIYYYADKNPNITIESVIKQRIKKRIRDYKIREMQLDKEQLAALDVYIELEPEPISEGAEDASSMTGAVGAIIGTFMGIIMYMTVFIYGMMVMRSVMEEKMNRIVEVMISSVRPFQLMMGKIIGVGAVGLTQVGIWAILIPIVYLFVILVFGLDVSAMSSGTAMADVSMEQEEMQQMSLQILSEIQAQKWVLIIPLFIFYFLGGYFLYASLFAAVGSAMGDDLGEGQALTIPITIPVVIAFYIMIVAVQAPHSNLAIWSSIFPLFSPIVMPARIAFDPAPWQILLSIAVLILSSIFFVWLSGRIYRVGILMYGKKVSLRELGKWLFYRD